MRDTSCNLLIISLNRYCSKKRQSSILQHIILDDRSKQNTEISDWRKTRRETTMTRGTTACDPTSRLSSQKACSSWELLEHFSTHRTIRFSSANTHSEDSSSLLADPKIVPVQTGSSYRSQITRGKWRAKKIARRIERGFERKHESLADEN